MTLAEPEGESSSSPELEDAEPLSSFRPPAPEPATRDLPAAALQDDRIHSKNFGLAVLYMVFMRTGWIFKTESIIMPAVLDVIGGSGWLRGCLPMLNRFGQSLPPLLASDRVRNVTYKKYGLFASTFSMGVCFLALSVLWYFTGGEKSWWLPLLFLVIYGVFFSSTGINQLLLNTVSGKLIRVDRRGRLALLGTVFGADHELDELSFLELDITDYTGMNGSLDFVLNTTGTESANIFIPESISSVPVPAAVWLFSSGLLGLVGLARRKKA